MFIVPIAFVILLVLGVSLDELTWLGAGLCLFVAVATLVVFAVFQWPVMIYFVGLTFADIVLILVIFKGDITIR